MTALALATLMEVAQQIHARKLSPVDLTRQMLDRIDALDPRFHSYVTVLADRALELGGATDDAKAFPWP